MGVTISYSGFVFGVTSCALIKKSSHLIDYKYFEYISESLAFCSLRLSGAGRACWWRISRELCFALNTGYTRVPARFREFQTSCSTRVRVRTVVSSASFVLFEDVPGTFRPKRK